MSLYPPLITSIAAEHYQASMALPTLSLMIDQLSATSSGVTSADPQDPTSAFAGRMYF
jgi:hypothetical protein